MVLPKIVAVGIYDSKIIRPGVTISKNRKVSMFEIEIPLEKGGVSYIDASSRAIDTNMLICAKPGQIRHTRFPYKCYYIHMILESGILYDILSDAPTVFEITKPDVYKNLFNKMIKHYNTFSAEDEIMVQSKLLELLYTIRIDTKEHIKIDGSCNNTSVIAKTLDYIDKNITGDLSLKTVATTNSLSAVHFHNMFKSATGKTLRQYVEEQRIKRATELLLTTNYNLTEIAYECGFSSQSYFSFVFKRKIKKTPREYVTELYDRYEL
ncbi:MAG: helix-turn-helix transcriptional regulator [Clostridia bacterium]|nr:helix-turn-helix transcriptional regulator [Clostridia bacterium]